MPAMWEQDYGVFTEILTKAESICSDTRFYVKVMTNLYITGLLLPEGSYQTTPRGH